MCVCTRAACTIDGRRVAAVGGQQRRHANSADAGLSASALQHPGESEAEIVCTFYRRFECVCVLLALYMAPSTLVCAVLVFFCYVCASTHCCAVFVLHFVDVWYAACHPPDSVLPHVLCSFVSFGIDLVKTMMTRHLESADRLQPQRACRRRVSWFRFG